MLKKLSKRRKNKHTKGNDMSLSNYTVYSIIFFATITLTSIVTITLLRPDTDNLSVITLLLGFFTTVSGLLVIRKNVENVHEAVNSRLTSLLEKTEQLARLQGHAIGMEAGKAEEIAHQKEVIKAASVGLEKLVDIKK